MPGILVKSVVNYIVHPLEQIQLSRQKQRMVNGRILSSETKKSGTQFIFFFFFLSGINNSALFLYPLILRQELRRVFFFFIHLP
jgi:hypothetical protein